MAREEVNKKYVYRDEPYSVQVGRGWIVEIVLFAVQQLSRTEAWKAAL